MAQGMYAPGAGGPPPGGAPGMPPGMGPGGMPPGEFMGPPPDNQPLQEGDDAGLMSELEGLLAAWEEKTPNTVAGQYFQDLARVLSKYA